MLIASLLLLLVAVLVIVRAASRDLSRIDDILTVVEPEPPAKPAT